MNEQEVMKHQALEEIKDQELEEKWQKMDIRDFFAAALEDMLHLWESEEEDDDPEKEAEQQYGMDKLFGFIERVRSGHDFNACLAEFRAMCETDTWPGKLFTDPDYKFTVEHWIMRAVFIISGGRVR